MTNFDLWFLLCGRGSERKLVAYSGWLEAFEYCSCAFRHHLNVSSAFNTSNTGYCSLVDPSPKLSFTDVPGKGSRSW